MNPDKIRIRGKNIIIDLDDMDATFSLVENDYDSDGARESEPYTVKAIIMSAEEHRERRDLEISKNWDKYQKELKEFQREYDRVKAENNRLTLKMKEKMLE